MPKRLSQPMAQVLDMLDAHGGKGFIFPGYTRMSINKDHACVNRMTFKNLKLWGLIYSDDWIGGPCHLTKKGREIQRNTNKINSRAGLNGDDDDIAFAYCP